MAKPKGSNHRNRQVKRPRGKMARAQRLRHLKKKEISDSKKAERKSLATENPIFKDQRVKKCSAFGCTEQFKIGSNIGFFKFPTNKIRRDLWIRAVKRMNWSPSFASVLCGKHFQTGKPSKSPVHPDYIPNIFFVADSVAKHQGRPPKDSSYPAILPNLLAFTNAVEKHKGHSSTAQTEESMCVIYDKIEIEDIPINTELSSSSIDVNEAVTSGLKSKVLRRIGTEVEHPTTEGVAVKKEEDEPLILDAAEIISESSRPKEDDISILKLKLNQAHTNIYTLRKKQVDILKRLTSSSAQQKILENYVNEKEEELSKKEEELSKLKKELKEAYKEINFLRSEKIVWQNHITDRLRDRIFQDTNKLHFFTGLNSAKDFQLLTKLLYDVDTTATSFSVSSQLLIVLMRLQLNLKYPDLADRFQTSVNTVRRVCESVIPHLGSKLKLFHEGLSPVDMQSNVDVNKHRYAAKYGYAVNTNSVFVKLYWTIQRFTKAIIKL